MPLDSKLFICCVQCVRAAGKGMQILPWAGNPSWILELGCWGCFQRHMRTRYLALAYLYDLRWGFIFNITECCGAEKFGESFCNSCGLLRRGCLGRAGCSKGENCLCCSGLSTPRRAPKLRRDGKGQQTLNVSKTWAKPSPSFITEQPQ